MSGGHILDRLTAQRVLPIEDQQLEYGIGRVEAASGSLPPNNGISLFSQRLTCRNKEADLVGYCLGKESRVFAPHLVPIGLPPVRLQEDGGGMNAILLLRSQDQVETIGWRTQAC
ncbi:hypothetical protein D3C73_963580 [compost metagenome]